MSATNRGSERVENDCYETPQRLADFLVDKLVADGFLPKKGYGEPGMVLEPSAGNGRFVSSLTRRTNYDVAACDIKLTDGLKIFNVGNTYCFEFDFLKFRGGWYDAIVGNPPYLDAEAHIRHGLELLRPNGVLAFLLRIQFLASAKRISFWETFPACKIYALSERPSFTEDGATDAADYAMFVWRRGHTGPTTLEVVSWK